MKNSKQSNKSALINLKKQKTELITIAIFSVLFLCCYFYTQFKSNQLDKNGEYTYGIIVGYQGVAKGDCNLKYCFFVKNVKYTSSDSHSLQYDKFSFGDTCFVKYDRLDPRNSELIKVNVNGHKVIKIKSRF